MTLIKKNEGEMGKADYAALGTAGAMTSMIAVAAKDTAIAAAKVMYPDDPVAAALATTEALTVVLKTTLAGTVEAGGRHTASSTPSGDQSKLAQETVLAGIMQNRTDDGKW